MWDGHLSPLSEGTEGHCVSLGSSHWTCGPAKELLWQLCCFLALRICSPVLISLKKFNERTLPLLCVNMKCRYGFLLLWFHRFLKKLLIPKANIIIIPKS